MLIRGFLNSGGKSVESLPVPDARWGLSDAQAAVAVDLSVVEQPERMIRNEGHTQRLNLVCPHGTGRERLPAFIFIQGGWVLGDYPIRTQVRLAGAVLRDYLKNRKADAVEIRIRTGISA